MDDLQRPASNIIDYVVADCEGLSQDDRGNVEVTVRKTSETRYLRNNPVSFEIDLVYETRRTDSELEKHPITRTETVANLCFDPAYDMHSDNPVLLTENHHVMTETRVQIFARLAHLAAMQRAGVVKNVFYQHDPKKPAVEVTDDVLMALSGEITHVPKKLYALHDSFTAA